MFAGMCVRVYDNCDRRLRVWEYLKATANGNRFVREHLWARLTKAAVGSKQWVWNNTVTLNENSLVTITATVKTLSRSDIFLLGNSEC